MSPSAKIKLQNEKKTSSLTRQVKEYVQEKFQTRHADVERTKSDDSTSSKGPRFGIRVLPPAVNEKLFGKSPSKMQADNENNTNIERTNEAEKMNTTTSTIVSTEFERQSSINCSGIRRDETGMPIAMPDTMMQAAMAAKENRKSAHVTINDMKKSKGLAPVVPPRADDPDSTTASTDTVIDMDMTDHAKMIVEEAIQSAAEHISRTMSKEFEHDFSDISQVDGEKMKSMLSNSSTPRSENKKLSSDTESQMAHGELYFCICHILPILYNLKQVFHLRKE